MRPLSGQDLALLSRVFSWKFCDGFFAFESEEARYRRINGEDCTVPLNFSSNYQQV